MYLTVSRPDEDQLPLGPAFGREGHSLHGQKAQHTKPKPGGQVSPARVPPSGNNGVYEYISIEDLSDNAVSHLQRALVEENLIQFQKIPGRNERSDQVLAEDLSLKGLFKIEQLNQSNRAEIEWVKHYRIRHLITGKYL